MKSLFGFIVEPLGSQRYKTHKEIAGEKIITSTSKEDAKNSNRTAVVLSTPVGYDGPVRAGHELIVHHNVFKYYSDMQGREKSGKSFLKNGTFIVEPDQWFMHREPGGEWRTHDKYCFVEPVPVFDFWMTVPGMEYHLVGRLAYSNKELEEIGVMQNDLVGFTPDSEYQFEIDGIIMYRMFTNNICIKIEN